MVGLVSARWRALSGNMRGAVLMFGSGLGFVVMAILIRIVAERIDPLQMAFLRSLLGWLIILPFVFGTEGGSIRTSFLRMHLTRAALGTVAMFCAYYAIAHMPLADYTALSFTRPLFATVFAVIVLKETVRWRRWTATVVGLLGVLVMVRPGAGSIEPATFIALGESISLALLIVIVKLMPQSERTLAMMFWFGVFAIPITFVPALVVWQWPTPFEWLMLVGMAMAGAASQWMFILAFRSGEASFVAPVDYVRLISAAAIGFLVFAELPAIWTWLGAAIIMASTFYIMRREARLGRMPRPPAQSS
ncbi:MAG: DMT family transporter [Dongiaceae bacterium]